MINKILISHPTGNANLRYLAKAMAEAHILSSFYTCIAIFKGSFLSKLCIGPLKMFLKRSFPQELRTYTHTKPGKEIGRLLAVKFGDKESIKHEEGKFSIDSIYKDLDNYIAGKLSKESGVYAYEDGALKSFNRAKHLNIKCLYDLPIGYWRYMRQLLETEIKNRPDWAGTLTGFNDSVEKLKRKDDEIALADAIFVASSFTKKSLELYPGKLAPIYLIPYGFPPVFNERTYEQIENRKIKLLFVGSLSQRKGLANILEAADVLSDYIELTIIGRKVTDTCLPLDAGLKKWNWIPSLGHDEILLSMRNHDIFVFPSLFEGFGLVITEAMSQGTPVITTDRTCAPDFINDDENGWIVNAGNTQHLIEKLKMIIADPSRIQKAGMAAMLTAVQRPMDVYGEEMVKALNNFINADN